MEMSSLRGKNIAKNVRKLFEINILDNYWWSYDGSYFILFFQQNKTKQKNIIS